MFLKVLWFDQLVVESRGPGGGGEVCALIRAFIVLVLFLPLKSTSCLILSDHKLLWFGNTFSYRRVFFHFFFFFVHGYNEGAEPYY